MDAILIAVKPDNRFGFLTVIGKVPQIQLVCALLSVQIRDAVTKQDHRA